METVVFSGALVHPTFASRYMMSLMTSGGQQSLLLDSLQDTYWQRSPGVVHLSYEEEGQPM